MRRGLSDAVLYDENKIYERYGISSKQLIDFKGLRGDPSDNIPGVFGIGEKTAVSLLQEFETLENIYKNIEKIKISVREKLTRDKMQAIKSKKLATIVRNVPVEFDLEKAKIDDFDKKKLVKLFEELNFFSLIKRIPQNKLDESENCSKKEKKNKSVKDFKYNFIIKEKENDFWKDLSQKKELSFKLETQERENGHNEILGVSFSWESGRAGYAKYSEKTRSFIKDIFENEKIVKIGYDLKISIKILFSYGIILKGKLYDIMLLAYVLDPGAKIDFPFLVLKELGEEIEERNNKGQLGLEIMSFQEKIEKICRQTDYIKKLKKIFEEKMEKISQTQKKQKNLETVFWEIEIPLVEILAQMEMNGILLNAFIFQGIS
ncbi:5'-3' exonuclease H3TH domain-containing protein, partial [Candidatus Infernicultor aquiphilus]